MENKKYIRQLVIQYHLQFLQEEFQTTRVQFNPYIKLLVKGDSLVRFHIMDIVEPRCRIFIIKADDSIYRSYAKNYIYTFDKYYRVISKVRVDFPYHAGYTDDCGQPLSQFASNFIVHQIHDQIYICFVYNKVYRLLPDSVMLIHQMEHTMSNQLPTEVQAFCNHNLFSIDQNGLLHENRLDIPIDIYHSQLKFKYDTKQHTVQIDQQIYQLKNGQESIYLVNNGIILFQQNKTAQLVSYNKKIKHQKLDKFQQSVYLPIYNKMNYELGAITYTQSINNQYVNNNILNKLSEDLLKQFLTDYNVNKIVNNIYQNKKPSFEQAMFVITNNLNDIINFKSYESIELSKQDIGSLLDMFADHGCEIMNMFFDKIQNKLLATPNLINSEKQQFVFILKLLASQQFHQYNDLISQVLNKIDNTEFLSILADHCIINGAEQYTQYLLTKLCQQQVIKQYIYPGKLLDNYQEYTKLKYDIIDAKAKIIYLLNYTSYDILQKYCQYVSITEFNDPTGYILVAKQFKYFNPTKQQNYELILNKYVQCQVFNKFLNDKPAIYHITKNISKIMMLQNQTIIQFIEQVIQNEYQCSYEQTTMLHYAVDSLQQKNLSYDQIKKQYPVIYQLINTLIQLSIKEKNFIISDTILAYFADNNMFQELLKKQNLVYYQNSNGHIVHFYNYYIINSIENQKSRQHNIIRPDLFIFSSEVIKLMFYEHEDELSFEWYEQLISDVSVGLMINKQQQNCTFIKKLSQQFNYRRVIKTLNQYNDSYQSLTSLYIYQIFQQQNYYDNTLYKQTHLNNIMQQSDYFGRIRYITIVYKSQIYDMFKQCNIYDVFGRSIDDYKKLSTIASMKPWKCK